ncbi:hypothetical protein LTS18_012768 [Coniosporium uncinatum]|uniref:Uncharacterized protein n=1 Tax=Coniosporium uncinatum TaxID=93489 RepID=A0ACC3CWV9_9PEZI|nr:hypothetical protein LTS18_012768 [Coniosporium uncinatum]
MCLLDTTDGALMMSLYTSASLARDPIAILYYSIVLTVVTVAVAVAIGVIQLLGLVLNVAEPRGRFWDGVEAAGEHYDVIGGAICASFLVFGGLSVLLYKPWRRRVDRRRMQALHLEEGDDHDDAENNSEGSVEFRDRLAAAPRASPFVVIDEVGGAGDGNSSGAASSKGAAAAVGGGWRDGKGGGVVVHTKAGDRVVEVQEGHMRE